MSEMEFVKVSLRAPFPLYTEKARRSRPSGMVWNSGLDDELTTAGCAEGIGT